MPNPAGTPLYRAVRTQAIRLLQKYVRSGRMPRASGHCADCGSRKYLRWDHRDYSAALTVEAVCNRCNARRGPGLVRMLDVGAWRWIDVPARAAA